MVNLEMPRMDGIQLLRTLRRNYPHCPPAVVTTSQMGRERMQAGVNESGADALLIKPLNAERLTSGLKRLIESIPDPTGPWTVPHSDAIGDALQRVLRTTCHLECATSAPLGCATSTPPALRSTVTGHGARLPSTQWPPVRHPRLRHSAPAA